MLMECVSIGISAFFFFLTFRIPVMYKRELTLDCRRVVKEYW